MRFAFLFAGACTLVSGLSEALNAEMRELLKPQYEGVAPRRGKLESLNVAQRQFIHER